MLLITSNNLPSTVWLVQNLASSDQDVIVNALRRPAECSLRREGIHAVAKLLKDPRGKVSASASSVLRSLAAQPRQRKQVRCVCVRFSLFCFLFCFVFSSVKWLPAKLS